MIVEKNMGRQLSPSAVKNEEVQQGFFPRSSKRAARRKREGITCADPLEKKGKEIPPVGEDVMNCFGPATVTKNEGRQVIPSSNVIGREANARHGGARTWKERSTACNQRYLLINPRAVLAGGGNSTQKRWCAARMACAGGCKNEGGKRNLSRSRGATQIEKIIGSGSSGEPISKKTIKNGPKLGVNIFVSPKRGKKNSGPPNLGTNAQSWFLKSRRLFLRRQIHHSGREPLLKRQGPLQKAG